MRLTLGITGVLLATFGVFRLVTQVPAHDLVMLALWLICALIIHDGILSPLVVGVGWVIARVVPARARRYLQIVLISGALVTVVAVPMIYRRGSQPRSKAILQQNFAGNLSVMLGIIAVLSLVAYAVRVARDRTGQPRPALDALPSDDQSSTP
jgi:hypothetical protein